MKHVALRLSFAQAAAGLVGGAYTPFFGAWLAWRGLPPGEIGALLSAGMLLRVIVAPVSGIIADARNDRRGVMLALYSITLLGYGALNWTTLPLLIFIAAVPANVASGAASPLLESVSVRLSERFNFDYGHVRLWASVLFVAGNLLSGVAVSIWGLVVIAPWLALSIALNVAAIYALPPPRANQKRGDFGLRMRATLAEARELLGAPVFLIFLAAASLDQGSHAFYYSYGGLHWRALGYSGALIGIIWPLGISAEILLMSFSLQVFRVVGATRLLLLGGIGCALRWTILAFDPPLPFVIFAQFLHGATFAMAHLGAMYFILKAVPPRLAATAQSLYTVCSAGLAMGLATFASGPLYSIYGGRVYLLMSAMGLFSALFAIGLGYKWHGGRITQSSSEEVLDSI
ncbi:MAG TPA: MFS transporter [Rhizomicrobium sp.]|nr:MFS transporter [Rhizomicrobium sp.]